MASTAEGPRALVYGVYVSNFIGGAVGASGNGWALTVVRKGATPGHCSVIGCGHLMAQPFVWDRRAARVSGLGRASRSSRAVGSAGRGI